MARMTWTDKTSEANTAGLMRTFAVLFNGLQYGTGEYATDGTTTIDAASWSVGTGTVKQAYATESGIFLFAVNGDHSEFYIYRSRDGIEAFSLVHQISSPGYARGYPATIFGCGAGRVMHAEYGSKNDTGNPPRLWYSEDGGENWSVLFTAATDAIKHYHGGIYDPKTGRIYLYTGDPNPQASIVFAASWDDLIANPSTYKTRWGLDDSSRSTIDTDWIVGYNSQLYRIVHGIFHGDYFYWGMDTKSNTRIARVHRETHEYDELYILPHSDASTGGWTAASEIWCLGLDNENRLIMATSARAPDDSGDDDVHVYRQIGYHGLYFEEIYSYEQDSPGTSGLPMAIYSIGGYTCVIKDYGVANKAGIVETHVLDNAYMGRRDRILLVPQYPYYRLLGYEDQDSLEAGNAPTQRALPAYVEESHTIAVRDSGTWQESQVIMNKVRV